MTSWTSTAARRGSGGDGSEPRWKRRGKLAAAAGAVAATFLVSTAVGGYASDPAPAVPADAASAVSCAPDELIEVTDLTLAPHAADKPSAPDTAVAAVDAYVDEATPGADTEALSDGSLELVATSADGGILVTDDADGAVELTRGAGGWKVVSTAVCEPAPSTTSTGAGE